METRFDQKAIKNGLSRLPDWKQVAFALLCCERMFPNYLMFVQDSGWGNPDALRRSLDVAWLTLAEGKSVPDLRDLVRACEDASPDTEDFASDYTSAALDAAVSTASLVETLDHFDEHKVHEICQKAFDTVYMYVDYSMPTPTDDKVVLMHPLIQSELAVQQDSIEYLKMLDRERRTALRALRSRCLSATDRSSFCRGSLPDRNQSGSE